MKPLKQSSKLRIGLADHHTLCRQGVRRLLEADRGLLVVSEASDGLEALRLTEQLAPDILLLEWSMPHMTGSDVLRALGAASSGTRVIILTDYIDRADTQTALELGARGVVLKESNSLVLIRAIRSVAGGEFWIGRESVADLIQVLRAAAVASGMPQEPSRRFGLTVRESEIVCAVAAACANKDIAQRFSITEKTVKHHLSNIFAKLGVSTRLELAVFALNNRDKPPEVPADRPH